MLAEEMELHDDLDYDDDTPHNCFELGHALQDLENANLDGECNVIAPFAWEDSTDSQNGIIWIWKSLMWMILIRSSIN